MNSKIALTIFCLALTASSSGKAQEIMVPRVTLAHPFFAPFLRIQSYDCSRTTCEQIRSCEEACYKLQVCGHRQRDGDDDGIPCENLCSRRCP